MNLRLIQYSMTCLCAGFLIATAANAAEVRGEISLIEKGKPAGREEYRDLVVFFVPQEGAPAAPLAEPVEMRMESKSFLPRVLPITKGSEVRFPNFDPILHNAFSTSANNSFDLGFYSGGESKSADFDNPGLVRVYCNVHHSMVGYILVLNTSHYSGAGNNGGFSLRDLPALKGELYIWHPRAKSVKRAIDLTEQQTHSLRFDMALTKRRVPQHLNKNGKSYRRSRARRY